MATQYPSTFPAALIDNFSIAVSMGAARAEIGGNRAQRRIYKTMPHVFALSFSMKVSDWSNWQQWVLTYGYRWFEMRLPNLYASQQGKLQTPTLIRFVSPVQATNTTESFVEVSVTAEMAPSMIAKYLEVA